MPMPVAVPVALGALMRPLRLLLPERSWSENKDMRVDERSRELDPERESLR